MNTGRIDEIYFEQEEDIHVTEKQKLMHKVSIATSPNIFGLIRFTINDIEKNNVSINLIGGVDLTDDEIMDIYQDTMSEYSKMFRYLYKLSKDKNRNYKILYDKKKVIEYENRHRLEYDFSEIEQLADKVEQQNYKLTKQEETKKRLEFKKKHGIKDISVDVEINFGY